MNVFLFSWSKMHCTISTWKWECFLMVFFLTRSVYFLLANQTDTLLWEFCKMRFTVTFWYNGWTETTFASNFGVFFLMQSHLTRGGYFFITKITTDGFRKFSPFGFMSTKPRIWDKPFLAVFTLRYWGLILILRCSTAWVAMHSHMFFKLAIHY